LDEHVHRKFRAGIEKRNGGKRVGCILGAPAQARFPQSSQSTTDKPIQGNDNMNTHLTIRPILTAAALTAVIAMTSAVSAASAEGLAAQGATIGAAGPYQPSPFVDYDNIWLTGTVAWNVERAMGWRP
jgi:hypothetical protein